MPSPEISGPGQSEDTPPIVALEVLLEDEVETLRRADFATLSHLIARKEALLEALGSGPPPGPAALDRLRRKAERNGQLLLAARRGLHAARRRIAELAQAARPETYDATGQRQGLAPPAGSLEHRA